MKSSPVAYVFQAAFYCPAHKPEPVRPRTHASCSCTDCEPRPVFVWELEGGETCDVPHNAPGEPPMFEEIADCG